MCWPWYGRHPSEDLWPAHGWARLLDWKLVDSREDEEGVTLKWRLELCDWQVDLHARLGSRMELSLSTEHQDSEPCQLSHALLAYWRISDVSEIALSGLEDIEGYDRLNRQVCREDGALKLKGGCQRFTPARRGCNCRTRPGSASCASTPVTATTPWSGTRATARCWA